ncbi:arginine--tRNA ligase [Methylophilaceae bacterium]|uniref:Arginine--tRNA ligase n=1 Tax=Methylophilales bacterium HTCC2181 TaxID=383631 RepID=A0P526_9PROT|nr:arginyl-tRNA synthetase [Methylophilales bacterium HTCC2181]MBT3513193.1 arginine--tRNA ligase [Nitrosomonadales bacterium]MBT5410719.1 arginine--tRNA ligase [Nitrosomonadales bacterium]MDA7751326.1 arginine--tRNA ligase [Methylophilaceae bacterium]MDA9085285.1 arginine--tRNA ligase [Methylophilaceae bacterium]
MKAHLTDLLFSIVNKMTSELTQSQIVIERPKSIDHGDLSSNIALVIAKALKKSPRTVAQEIVEKIPSTRSFSKIEIAGAGFLNFYFSSNTHNKIINDALENNKNYGRSNQGSRKKIQIEFVSANPTGPLHVGHGRGAAIGDCLARLFEFSGWDVTREFYYNDAGSQIDNLTKSIKARCMNVLPEDPSFPEDGYRGEYISDIAKSYLAKKTIQNGSETFSSNGDTTDDDAIKNYGIHYLRKEQDQDLEAFKIRFDVFSLESSFYSQGKIKDVVTTLKNNGHTYEKDGALWLKTTAFGDDKDRVMQKSDGAFTYFVPDIAYHLNKWERGFKRVINEQGADHHSTVNRVRAGLQGLDTGIPPGWPEYVLHQMITVMKNGQEVKISKRAGSYVTLRDLIDEVGCDATRYFLIARRADSQLVFDIDLAKSQNNENPVYYIQYAHARIQRVLMQWGGELHSLRSTAEYKYETLLEKKLIKKIEEFPEVVEAATNDLAPHQIANYLKECAADLHGYYNDTKFLVENNNEKNGRLSLIFATQHIIKTGLNLLGISAPDSM